MHEKIISYASIVFFVCIAFEFLLARKRKRHEYRINDAINSLSLGVMSQISGVFLKALSIGIYSWIYQHTGWLQLDASNPLVWLSGLLFYDFLYYWLHRFGHETSLLWAAHVVHHQSESYNLSTALRQTSSGALFGWVFYVPMALLGWPPEVFLVIALIDLLYQFWVHTEQIGKLGWFDRIFVSPSNHRVHHAVNDIYLDKNYGGILIIWDRLFGTYSDELDQHPVVFGTRSPLRSWNPLWANLEVYLAVAKDAWHTRRYVDKLKIWLMPPGWRPADLPAYDKQFDLKRALYNPPISKGMTWYCLLQFAALLQVGTDFLLNYPQMLAMNALMLAAWQIFSLWSLGGLMERPRIFIWPELVRLVMVLAMVVFSQSWFYHYSLPSSAVALLSAASICSLLALTLIVYYDNHGSAASA